MWGFINVDDRGGYFKQGQMQEARVQPLDDKGLLQEATTRGQIALCSVGADEVLETMAYKTRVMLSHLRRRCDMREDHQIPELGVLF